MRRWPKVASALIAIICTIGTFGPVQFTSKAYGANGTIVRQLQAQGYNCSLGTGIAFDGVNLLLSCSNDNKIYAINPDTGALVRTYEITGLNSIGALAFDRGRHMLWACGGFSADDKAVYLIDHEGGNPQAIFKFRGNGCVDGLAYDGSDETLWMSADVASTIYHHKLDGTVLGSFSPPLGSCGNSGIAVGGDQLFLANNGCSQIYQAPKSNPTTSELFGTYSARLEDLECDDVTMGAEGKALIWSKDAYDNVLNAFELNPGTCGFGGMPSVIDTDHDGISDDWETNGIWKDGKKVADLAALGADPHKKDVFIRIDAESGAFLSGDAEPRVASAFADEGIAVHFLRGKTIDATTANGFLNNGSVDYAKLYGFWKSEAPYEPFYAHYALGTHWSSKDFPPEAQSSGIPAQQIVMRFCGSDRKAVNCPLPSNQQAAYFMHELGHNLGLHHGGNDDIGFKPNYLSIMNYSFTFKGEVTGIGLTYSHWGPNDLYSLDENSLAEQDGVKSKPGGRSIPSGATTYFYCEKDGKESDPLVVGSNANWDCSKKNSISNDRVKADITSPRGYRPKKDWSASYDMLNPYDDWANLVFSGGNIGRVDERWVEPAPVDCVFEHGVG